MDNLGDTFRRSASVNNGVPTSPHDRTANVTHAPMNPNEHSGNPSKHSPHTIYGQAHSPSTNGPASPYERTHNTVKNKTTTVRSVQANIAAPLSPYERSGNTITSEPSSPYGRQNNAEAASGLRARTTSRGNENVAGSSTSTVSGGMSESLARRKQRDEARAGR